MKKLLNLVLLAASSALIFTSCKKSNSQDDPDPNLLGTWKLISMKLYNISDIAMDDYRAVTTTDYETTNNSGTLTFEPNRAIAKDISYDIATDLSAKFYEKNVLTDSYETPFEYSIRGISTTTEYTRTGDSLYFHKAFINNPNGVDTPIPTTQTGSGVRYSISGNRLTYTAKIYFNQSTNYQGTYVSVFLNGVAEAVYEKQ